MVLLKPQNFRSFSSVPSLSHELVADRAITLLERHPYHLHSIVPEFTPEAASYLLNKCQNNKPIILKFLRWAHPHQFFTIHCKCMTLHILTRFKIFNEGLMLAQEVAVNTPDDNGSAVFQCLKDTYQLCNSSSAVFDLVVKSYSHVNYIDKALNIVNLAKSDGFMPGVLAYNAILDSIIRCRKPVGFAQEVYREMIASGVSLNVYSYNILIRGFCAAGNLEMGLQFFKEMESSGRLPNVVTYNTVIDAYCKLKKVDEAIELLSSMVLKGMVPNLITFNILINGLCREGRMKEAVEFLAEMRRRGFAPDEVTYNTLSTGYCKEGNFYQALVLHAEMVRNGLSPNVVTYTSLINSMCRAGNLKRAMEFFDQMLVRGLKPNEKTYTTLINGFSQQGCLNEAYRVLDDMTRSGFSPSIITYNALINGHCILGRMDEAIGVLREMERKGLPPDAVSYGTVIAGFSRNQELEKAFQMKAAMLEKGFLADSITYSSLIQGLCEQRRLDEASDLFREMLHMGLSPDEFTYTSLINAYCKEGDLSKAMHWHDQMIKKGFQPDVVTYSVLINGLNRQARNKEARRLLLKLFHDENVPDQVTYNTLIENCSNIELKSVVALIKGFCMKGLMDEADQAFESMTKGNHKPNEAVYNVIIHGHCRGGNVQKAHNLYKEMIQFGFFPHTVTVIVLAKALFNAGMEEELNQVIASVLRNCNLSDAERAKILIEVHHKEGNMDVVFDLLTEMARDGLLPSSGTPYQC